MRLLYMPKKSEHKPYMHVKKEHEEMQYKMNGEPMAEEHEEMKELIVPDGIERVIADVVSIMETPPETWHKYENAPSKLWEIIRMETKELEKAYLAMKQGEGTHEAFVKELLHLSVATLQAYKKMTCDK